MEGILFYFAAWSFWIISTFFLNKNSRYRLKSSFCILLMIILKPYHIELLDITFNLAAIFLYIFILTQVIQFNRRTHFYLTVSSFIVMLAYVSFQLFELYDPVWVMFKREWMLAIGLVYLSVLLHSDKKLRLFVIIIGILQGEFLFSLILRKLNFSYTIGTGMFFDALASAGLLLFFWSVMEIGIVNFENFMSHQGKGKQKST